MTGLRKALFIIYVTKGVLYTIAASWLLFLHFWHP